MNITVKKNRLLTIANYKLKCSIGKSGIKKIKKEGDLATPKGTFKLGYLYYRKDNIYDLLINIKYNSNPVTKLKGSAIFLHLASAKYKATAGCVAISKKNFLKILPHIKINTKIKII